jgi:hypothetical protein
MLPGRQAKRPEPENLWTTLDRRPQPVDNRDRLSLAWCNSVSR